MHIVTGAVIRDGNKYLLVQESKASLFGLWNLPAGHLDIGETLMEGARREAKEESNCDIELTGICQIGNFLWPNDSAVTVIFTARPLSSDIKPQPGEILDAKWFTYEEIIAMQDKLRNAALILGAIEHERNHKVLPLDFIAISRSDKPRA